MLELYKYSTPASLPAGRTGVYMLFLNGWEKLKESDASLQAGLRFGEKGTHTSRTIMLTELKELLSSVPKLMERKDYAAAIIEDNVLGKQTVSTRRLTNQRLGELYGLSSSTPIFRVLHRLWKNDRPGRPMLALLCALGRDPLLRITAPLVLSLDVGEELVRSELVATIKSFTDGRFNDSILDKIARNVGSSWTQSGHLEGRVRKIRKHVEPTHGAVAFSLWLGSLFSFSGEALFSTPWTDVFDCDSPRLLELTLKAKQQRLVDAIVGGGVIEINPMALDPAVEV